MPLFATVQPGVTVTTTTAVTSSILNRLGTPTVDIVGEVDGTGSVTIADGTIADAKLVNMTGPTLKGRRSSTPGPPTDVAIDSLSLEMANIGATGTLQVAAGGILTAHIATASSATTGVTYAKMQQVTAARLIGNPTQSLAAPSEISLGTGLSFVSGVLSLSSGGVSNLKYRDYKALTTVQSLGTGSSLVDVTNLSITLTPASASSKFILLASLNGGVALGGYGIGFYIYQSIAGGAYALVPNSVNTGVDISGTSQLATSAVVTSEGTTTTPCSTSFMVVDTPSTASEIIYKISCKQRSGASAYINAGYAGTIGDATYTKTISTFMIVEVLA